ncbi:MAG TPA: hypothetical protein VIP31_01890 [Acidovorax sp.]|jgi:hypothetical protein
MTEIACQQSGNSYLIYSIQSGLQCENHPPARQGAIGGGSKLSRSAPAQA